MSGVPNVFGSATSSIPLSQLDVNFNTPLYIGNTSVGLGNTVTSFGNVTLTNATISGNLTATSITGGTANGVVYLSSGNVVTANPTVLAFDGSNLGLGVTPSAWNASYKAIQVGGGTSIWSGASGNQPSFYSNNLYFNGTNRLYLQNGYATEYVQSTSGTHNWYIAPSGTAGNAITFTQAMTLDNSGNLLVGQNSAGIANLSSYAFQLDGQGIRNNHGNGTPSGYAYMQFGYNGGSIGSITQSGTTAVLYNVMSDQRLKENIVDALDASDDIDAIKVRSFNFISDKSNVKYGFIAQELVTVAPDAVHQPENLDEMMGVDYSKLVPMMLKEIQSLRKRLATLEAKVGV